MVPRMGGFVNKDGPISLVVPLLGSPFVELYGPYFVHERRGALLVQAPHVISSPLVKLKPPPHGAVGPVSAYQSW